MLARAAATRLQQLVVTEGSWANVQLKGAANSPVQPSDQTSGERDVLWGELFAYVPLSQTLVLAGFNGRSGEPRDC